MSNSTEVPEAGLPIPQPSKKRRLVAETPEKSKKRKHKDRDDAHSTSRDIVSRNNDDTKEKKKKKKKKEEEDQVSGLSQESDIQNGHRAGKPNAPPQMGSQMTEMQIDDEIVANGVNLEDVVQEIEMLDESLLPLEEPSCFYEKRLSLQLPIPAVGLSTSLSSLLSLHLAPILLTYFPPADGIVLSFSDAVISAKPGQRVNLPLRPPKSGELPRHQPEETLVRCADVFGVCWAWLTVTLLVFRPEPGDKLTGWTNVSSEGFVGLVSYNYFQTAIGKSRIPKSWRWDGPATGNIGKRRKLRKEKLKDEDAVDENVDENVETAAHPDQVHSHVDVEAHDTGSFVDANGARIPGNHTFKVVDIEMVPGHEKDRWTLQIDGSLLSDVEEESAIAEQRRRFEQVKARTRRRSETPEIESGRRISLMSGAVSSS